MSTPPPRIVHAAAAHRRLDAARAWLAERSPTERVLVLAAHPEAAYQLLLSHLQTRDAGALFGPHRMTPYQLATELALPRIIARGLKPVGTLGREALAARVVYRLSERGQLGRFAAVANRPGVPRAMIETFFALRQAELTPDQVAEVDGDLAVAFREYGDALHDNGLVDQTDMLREAAEVAQLACGGDGAGSALLGVPLLGLDLGILTPLMARFVAAVTQVSPASLWTVPSHDQETLERLTTRLGIAATRLDPAGEIAVTEAATSLEAIQHGLFQELDQPTRTLDASVRIVSAPGEGRECLEIARAIRRHAAEGVPFDQIAVALRTPARYRVPLVEALRRAAIPAWLGREARGPDPGGRALLALLACADEGLSSRRFSEYLALGEVPKHAGVPTPTTAESDNAPDLWAAPIVGDWAPMGVTAQADDDVFGAPPPDPSADSDTDDAVVDGQLRAPRQWEHMLEQAAVIGGVDRWHSRLERLSNELSRRLSGLTDPDDPARLAIYRDLRRLERLRAFALPLIDALDALPTSAHWQTWLTAIEGIARQALRQPRPIHALLQELAPMAPVGPVTLAEVRLVLEPRLRELRPERSGRAAGQVAVSTIDELRGRSFSHVFIPGLQEKVFPRQIAEDPLLLDVTRERLAELHGIALPTQVARATRERVALAIAVGAASKGVVASYARLDAEKARPRVPSFYGLELLRAAEGILPDYKVLAARAEGGQPIRLGWPAPDHPEVALDDAEYDLAVLRRLLADPADSAADGDGDRRGLAHYLLETSPHLARALRFRARREWPKWTPADGLLVDPVDGTTLAALSHHQLTARSFSATALQRFSECPYQFLLNTVHKLAPVEERVPLERLDPLHRGSLFHEVQYEVMVALDKAGLLPLSEARLPDAMDVLETALTQVAADYEAALAPAIDRVWQDELTQLRADLRGSLRRVAYDPQWQPERFELSFGLSNRDQADPASQVEPVVLDTGLQLRGSIDLVERDGQGHRRATDYKTGKPKGDSQTVIAGGSILQPVLYALALEKLMPEATVESGRLYYSTERAGYVERVIPLDDVAREAAEKVTLAVDEALRTGHFPAHPRPLKYRGHACRWCDYRVVCGPHVPSFVKKKRADPRLIPLLQLRDEP